MENCISKLSQNASFVDLIKSLICIILTTIIVTLQNPDKIIDDKREDAEYFFKYYKHKKQKSKFFKVVVKYINEEGTILSAHFVRHIS